jgi:hypothetical protein
MAMTLSSGDDPEVLAQLGQPSTDGGRKRHLLTGLTIALVAAFVQHDLWLYPLMPAEWDVGARDWFATVVSFVLLIAACYSGRAALKLHREAGIQPVYAIFVIVALIPTFLLQPAAAIGNRGPISGEQIMMSLSGVQIWVIVLMSLLAQLIFAAEAWTLRRYSGPKVLAGCHSGLVFALLNVLTFFIVGILPVADQPVRAAFNGEFWPLLGAAQLLVAVTSGWNECQAIHTEVAVERAFSILGARKPCPNRKLGSVLHPRTTVGRCIHAAPRLAHETRQP